MRRRAVQVGSLCFALWGAIHVVGGGFLLLAALAGEDRFLAAQVGRELPSLVFSAADAPFAVLVAKQVFGFHAFNLTWIGAVVLVVAIRQNWRNSRSGFWLNSALVGLTDLGLAFFLVRTGILGWSDAWIGPALLVPAVIGCGLGRHAGGRWRGTVLAES